ncbi:hypothetical protein AVEN_247373-1, partial [Araneus ventricosus]
EVSGGLMVRATAFCFYERGFDPWLGGVRSFVTILHRNRPTYIDILMLKEGKGKVKDRFYSSKDLQNSNLVIECTHTKKNPLSSFMRLVVVTQPHGSMKSENYKQCNCSTSVNTCKISMRSLITLNQLSLTLKEQERGSASHCTATRRKRKVA